MPAESAEEVERLAVLRGLRLLLLYAEAFEAIYDIDKPYKFGEWLQNIITDVDAAFPRLKRGSYAYNKVQQLTGQAISLCKDAADVCRMTGEYRRDVKLLSEDDEKYLSHPITKVNVAPVSSKEEKRRLQIIELKIIMVAVVARLLYTATK
jgi:hypothetical protein